MFKINLNRSYETRRTVLNNTAYDNPTYRALHCVLLNNLYYIHNAVTAQAIVQ